MADFKDVHKISSGYKSNVWKASQSGGRLYLSECYITEQGQERACKSKNGSIFMLPVSVDAIPAFITFLNDVAKKIGSPQEPVAAVPYDDDVPF